MSSTNQRSEAIPQKILINPNFNQSVETQAKHNVHINPRFQQQLKTPNPPEQGLPKNVHINPNFAARPLPDIPSAKDKKQYYVNPSFLDPTKAKAYDDNVKKVIESKRIFLNPKKFQPTPVAPKAVSETLSSGSSSEKENIGAKRRTTTPTASATTTSHCKKSLFKKIGTRKLIRVKSSSAKKYSDKNNDSVCVQKINSPIVNRSAETSKTKFRKIGTKKLVRVKSVGLLTTPPLTSPGRYKLRTKRKIIVKTPRSLFSTPFSLRRKRVQNFSAKSPSPKYVNKKSGKSFGNRFSNMFSPFRVDRRAQITPAMTPKLSTVTEKQVSKFEPKQSSNPEEKYKKPVPPKPARKGPATTLINVQGVRYTVSDNGRKLNRVETKLTETPKLSVTPKSTNESAVATTPVEILPRKLYLDGEEYIEDEPGVLIRSRNSMTRQSITSYKNRSINTILKSQTRSKQYCMFYNKFGKCNKRDKGMCPYIHDASKVAVCRKFLQANCHNDNCLLSHQVAPDKMPSCKFFIQGLCTRDPCPYRHVHVNSEAEVCPDFLKGFCPAGAECKKKHFYEKSPEKSKPDESGEVVMREKKIPPAKPKRKSICQTPLMTEKKARVRYYDEKEPEDSEKDKPEADQEDSKANNQMEPVRENSPSYEQKRKRLLRKVELAKQGWTGMAVVDVEKTSLVQPDQLDDSGPYEEIPDDYPDQKTGRAPIGRLPSFISLDSSKSLRFDENLTDNMNDKVEENVDMDEREEETFDERLI